MTLGCSRRRSSARWPRSPPSARRRRPSRAANDTEYGLVAYVYTSDLKRALRVAEGLDTGMVGLNQGMVSNASGAVRRRQAVRLRPRGRQRGHRRVPGDQVRGCGYVAPSRAPARLRSGRGRVVVAGGGRRAGALGRAGGRAGRAAGRHGVGLRGRRGGRHRTGGHRRRGTRRSGSPTGPRTGASTSARSPRARRRPPGGVPVVDTDASPTRAMALSGSGLAAGAGMLFVPHDDGAGVEIARIDERTGVRAGADVAVPDSLGCSVAGAPLLTPVAGDGTRLLVFTMAGNCGPALVRAAVGRGGELGAIARHGRPGLVDRRPAGPGRRRRAAAVRVRRRAHRRAGPDRGRRRRGREDRAAGHACGRRRAGDGARPDAEPARGRRRAGVLRLDQGADGFPRPTGSVDARGTALALGGGAEPRIAVAGPGGPRRAARGPDHRRHRARRVHRGLRLRGPGLRGARRPARRRRPRHAGDDRPGRRRDRARRSPAGTSPPARARCSPPTSRRRP